MNRTPDHYEISYCMNCGAVTGIVRDHKLIFGHYFGFNHPCPNCEESLKDGEREGLRWIDERDGIVVVWEETIKREKWSWKSLFRFRQ
jgi:hypothetical protein